MQQDTTAGIPGHQRVRREPLIDTGVRDDEQARKREPGEEAARIAREAASKFMWAMAGDLPGFEEASRVLFAKDQELFEGLIRDWPEDIRGHLTRLVQESVRLETADAPTDNPFPTT